MFSRFKKCTNSMVSEARDFAIASDLETDRQPPSGPIVRITPDELHVSDAGFLDTVYAPSTSPRDKYEYQLRTLRVPGGVGTTARHDLHKVRREALAPFFSKRNVITLEPLIAGKVKQMVEAIAKHAKDKTPANLSDIFFGFSNEYEP